MILSPMLKRYCLIAAVLFCVATRIEGSDVRALSSFLSIFQLRA